MRFVSCFFSLLLCSACLGDVFTHQTNHKVSLPCLTNHKIVQVHEQTAQLAQSLLHRCNGSVDHKPAVSVGTLQLLPDDFRSPLNMKHESVLRGNDFFAHPIRYTMHAHWYCFPIHSRPQMQFSPMHTTYNRAVCTFRWSSAVYMHAVYTVLVTTSAYIQYMHMLVHSFTTIIKRTILLYPQFCDPHLLLCSC
jgi:hypothetical protein